MNIEGGDKLPPFINQHKSPTQCGDEETSDDGFVTHLPLKRYGIVFLCYSSDYYDGIPTADRPEFLGIWNDLHWDTV